MSDWYMLSCHLTGVVSMHASSVLMYFVLIYSCGILCQTDDSSTSSTPTAREIQHHHCVTVTNTKCHLLNICQKAQCIKCLLTLKACLFCGQKIPANVNEKFLPNWMWVSRWWDVVYVIWLSFLIYIQHEVCQELQKANLKPLQYTPYLWKVLQIIKLPICQSQPIPWEEIHWFVKLVCLEGHAKSAEINSTHTRHSM